MEFSDLVSLIPFLRHSVLNVTFYVEGGPLRLPLISIEDLIKSKMQKKSQYNSALKTKKGKKKKVKLYF